VRSDGIDDGRLLANEQMSDAMEAQAALLLGCLGQHEALVSPGLSPWLRRQGVV